MHIFSRYYNPIQLLFSIDLHYYLFTDIQIIQNKKFTNLLHDQVQYTFFKLFDVNDEIDYYGAQIITLCCSFTFEYLLFKTIIQKAINKHDKRPFPLQ